MNEQELEKKIENKEVTPEQLPENSPAQKEAEQLYDNNPNNDEVNNEALDKTVVAEDDYLKDLGRQNKRFNERNKLKKGKLFGGIAGNGDVNAVPTEEDLQGFSDAVGLDRSDVRDTISEASGGHVLTPNKPVPEMTKEASGIDDVPAFLWNDKNKRYEANVLPEKFTDKSDKKWEVEDAIENHPEEVKDIVEDTPLEKETEQVLDTTETKDDEVNNDTIEETPPEVIDELADKDRFLRGEYGYNSLEDLDKAASDFGYSIDDYDVYQDTDDIGDYFYALKKAVESGDEQAVNDVIEEATEEEKPLFQNAEPIDFESFAKQAQEEQDAVDAQKREAQKANAEMNLGRGTGGMVMKSTGFLGGRHWYDVSPDTLAEYSNQLIEDGEALLGSASDMGKQLSENDAWDSASRGNVGAVATHGNGLLKRGQRLQAVSGYLQKNGIDPSSLTPKQRKYILGIPLPGDKWNRKGTQEEYEHNLDIILNLPSATPKVIENTVIKPIEEEVGPLPEEVKADVIEEPAFFQSLVETKGGIDWDKVAINEPVQGMGWNNGRVDDFDPNGPDFVSNDEIEDEDITIDDNTDTGVVDYGLEDQNQYPESATLDETVIDEDMAKKESREEDWEKVPGFENIDNVAQLKQETEQEVDEDEDISEEEKEAVKERRNRIIDWYVGQKISMSGTGVSVNTPKPETPKSGLSVGGGVGMGSLFRNMPRGGSGSVSSPSVSGGKVSPNQYKPQAFNAKAGGGSKPVVPQSSTPVSIKNGKNSSGIANTSGGYSSGPVSHTSSRLSARSVTTGSSGSSKPTSKGVTLKAQKTLGGNKSTGNFNIDKFIDAVIKDSHTWVNPTNSGDKFKPYTVEIGDGGSVLINNTKVEKAVTKDPECVSYIMERIG